MRLYHRSRAAATIREHGFYSRAPVRFADSPAGAGPEPGLTLVFEVADERVSVFEDRSAPGSFTVPPAVANTFFPIVDQIRVDHPERPGRTAGPARG